MIAKGRNNEHNYTKGQKKISVQMVEKVKSEVV